MIDPYGLAPPGHRLPADTRLGPVGLQVSDLARSLAYYEHVLGLRPLAPVGPVGPVDAPAVLAAAEGDDRPLVVLHQKAGVRPVPRGGLIGLYHFAIRLPDRAALGWFAGHLAAIGARVGTADHAVSEAVYVTDPDGLGIEVYADRPRAAWRYDSKRQLHMTTEPLDVQALVESSGGAAWTGMPAGTVMGHVHLHVGDLDVASAFYHSALGFDKVVWDYPGALFLSAGGYHHHLGTNTWSSGQPADDRHARLLSWDIVVPRSAHALAAAESLMASGYEVTAIDNTWRATDPWGTPLRIVADA